MTSEKVRPPPRVSVVLPTYRRPEMLDRAIEAVLSQTFRDLELIVVDDNGAGSEAQRRTGDVLARHAGERRLVYLVHPTNRGGGGARNTGIRRARGEFVAFLDDDDAWDPEKLEHQVARFDEEDNRVALVYCRSRVVDEASGASGTWPTDGRSHSLRDLLRRNTVGSTSLVLCRRSALEEVGGFDERLPAKQDVDLYVRLASRFSFAFVDSVLHTRYRHGGASIGKDLEGAIRAHEIFHDKHADLIAAYPEVRHHRLLAIGRLYLASGRRADARGALWQAWRERPLHRETLGYLALVLVDPWGVAYALARRLKRARVQGRVPVKDRP